MLARAFTLFLVAGICCAETAEPKPRPRLTPPVVSELPAARQPAPGAGSASPFRSFDDYLQAGARRPVGLEVYREPRATQSEAVNEGKPGQASRDTAPTPSGTTTAGGEILVLPKLEITTEKLTKLEKELAALEASQSWWSSSAEAWKTRSEGGRVLDAILNPPIPWLRLGNYSGDGRAAVARQRVELLRWVRILTISLEEAKTPAEKARIQADIDGITGIMRYWD